MAKALLRAYTSQWAQELIEAIFLQANFLHTSKKMFVDVNDSFVRYIIRT